MLNVLSKTPTEVVQAVDNLLASVKTPRGVHLVVDFLLEDINSVEVELAFYCFREPAVRSCLFLESSCSFADMLPFFYFNAHRSEKNRR